MEGYLDGLRNEEDKNCDFCTGNFDGDNLGRFANLEEVKLYLERTDVYKRQKLWSIWMN